MNNLIPHDSLLALLVHFYNRYCCDSGAYRLQDADLTVGHCWGRRVGRAWTLITDVLEVEELRADTGPSGRAEKAAKSRDTC